MGTRFFFLAATAAVLLAGCSPEPEPAPPAEPQASAPAPAPAPAPAATPAAQSSSEIPATIEAERGGFIPEGIEYDLANERFLTGSLAEGSIFEIDNDGSVVPFIRDAELVSSVGIEVDEPRDRLLVANSDRAVFQGGGTGQAKLGIYSLTTGERMAMVDLAAVIEDAPGDAAYFANDVAVANDGTAYVTDTRMNLVYRVGTDNEASVLHRFEAMEGAAPNGIVHHPDGFLLVVAGNRLFKLPTDNPAGTSEVMVDEPVPGSDGAVWTPDGSLAIVSNSQDAPAVVALTSNDNWSTAQRAGVATFGVQATTAAVVDGDVYVVHPHFADQDPPSIERVALR
jgi:hypothetical protein